MSLVPRSCAAAASRLRALLLGRPPNSCVSSSSCIVQFCHASTRSSPARKSTAPGSRSSRTSLRTRWRAPAQLGASQAEADVSLQKGLTTTVRLGEVETVEYQRDRGMGVTVYFGKRKGSASTADLSARAVAETVEKACDIARYTAEDDCSGLADPDELARDIPDLDLDHPWDMSPEQAVECARACEAAGREVDTRITNSEGATVGSHRGVRVYGNSHGFLGGYPSTSHSISCVLLAQAGDDMQRDYWYSSARDARDLESAETIGRKAGERAVARLRRAQADHATRARVVRARSGARPHRAFPRRGARQQPVSQELVPARRGGAAGVSRLLRVARTAAHPQGAGQHALRLRRRGHP